MACEAAFQRATIRGQDLGSSYSYKLRDVLVKKPLILTEASEVELSSTMKPWMEGSKSRSSQWNEFAVYSHTKGTGWLEHCSGLCSLVKRNRVRKSSITRAWCQNMDRIVVELCSTAPKHMTFGAVRYGLRIHIPKRSRCQNQHQVLRRKAYRARHSSFDAIWLRIPLYSASCYARFVPPS